MSPTTFLLTRASNDRRMDLQRTFLKEWSRSLRYPSYMLGQLVIKGQTTTSLCAFCQTGERTCSGKNLHLILGATNGCATKETADSYSRSDIACSPTESESEDFKAVTTGNDCTSHVMQLEEDMLILQKSLHEAVAKVKVLEETELKLLAYFKKPSAMVSKQKNEISDIFVTRCPCPKILTQL